MRYFPLCVALLIACAALGQAPLKNGLRAFSAPTYYIAVEGQNYDPDGDLVRFRGASNLPAGSNILITIEDFDHDAWKDYSDRLCVAVEQDGFFNGQIPPKREMRFRNGLVLRANFQTNLCQQPADVIRIVGSKGEHLGEKDAPFGELAGVSRNPQLYQVSGPYYGLETIARID